jgi:FxLD family lantipeptide
MSIQADRAPATFTHPDQAPTKADLGEWELDITIIESGPAADKLIYMTDDGCGSTCQSACSGTCPV